MTTVAELIAAAAELNILELKELRMAIQRLEQRRPGQRFDLGGFSFGLTRLDDGAYLKLCRSSIAIEDDDVFFMRLVHSLFSATEEPQERRWLKLAEVRFVLEHLYGESSLIYDDYKGSFAFPCALDVIKAETVFPYLVIFRDHRGWLEFSLRKCVGSERQADTHIHPPFEDEFSRKGRGVPVVFGCKKFSINQTTYCKCLRVVSESVEPIT